MDDANLRAILEDNLRAILDDCREQLGVDTLPLSYAVRPKFLEVEEIVWREKYNIHLLPADGADFLVSLKDTWQAQNRVVLPLVERKLRPICVLMNITAFERSENRFI